jgi:hypothetical protein
MTETRLTSQQMWDKAYGAAKAALDELQEACDEAFNAFMAVGELHPELNGFETQVLDHVNVDALRDLLSNAEFSFDGDDDDEPEYLMTTEGER